MGWFLKKSDQEAYICRGFAKDTLIVNNFNTRNTIFKYVHQLKLEGQFLPNLKTPNSVPDSLV